MPYKELCPKLFIGPMSKNVVDSALELSNDMNIPIGFIPSRRQVEWNGGYVNKWDTKEFIDYVRSKSTNIVIERDHGGPLQGKELDDGMESYRMDALLALDIIHIDPWKKCKNYRDGLYETIEAIKYCHNINKNMKFEIGTEEAIRYFSESELNDLITDVKNGLGIVFDMVKYVVVQSGTGIIGTTNIGSYDRDRLKNMSSLCKSHGLLSKEHNGDYLTTESIKDRFTWGLDAINIAPEFGVIETRCILNELKTNNMIYDIVHWYDICLDSRKWEKWVPLDYVPSFDEHEFLIELTGHYTFSHPEFIDIKNKLNIDDVIKNEIKKSIERIYE